MANKTELLKYAETLNLKSIKMPLLLIPSLQLTDFDSLTDECKELLFDDAKAVLKAASSDIVIDDDDDEIIYLGESYGSINDHDDFLNTLNHLVLKFNIFYLGCFEKLMPSGSKRVRWIASTSLNDLIESAINHPDYNI